MKQFYTIFRAILISIFILGNINLAYAQTGLQFNGSNQYVTFGAATSTLGAQSFTIECWFKRTGTGVAATTGAANQIGTTGGISAFPLITKGRGEADGSTVDANYFLGINSGTAGYPGAANVLAADFEEGTGTTTPGLNHPVCGVTPILNNVWYHAAVTYDTPSRTWRLLLNGNLEIESVLTSGTRFPQYLSIQHAGLATAFNSSGAASGYFAGVIDEARIWNYARTQSEIQASMNIEVTSGIGLLGRWGLNDGTGTIASNSISLSPAGTLTNGPTWVPGAPAFAPPVTLPLAPSGTNATAASAFQINLGWTDNSDNETNFEIERSTTGTGGTYSLLATVGAGTISYNDAAVNSTSEYCYRVRATNSSGASGYSNSSCATTPAEGANGLQMTPSAYVTFGAAPSLATQNFTVETWFKRTGTGTSNTTGAGGITIIPIISKGAPEADGSTVDANYMLGINTSGNVIAADFEEGTGSVSAGLNHPLSGTTVIQNDVWYHAAVTFAGGVFSLYLNGVLENSATFGANVWPQGASIQHSALGTMLTSTGTALGFFAGVIDESRIWNYARNQTEIRADINSQITSAQTGLLARWGLNEGTGTIIHSSVGTSVNGTITTANYTWVTPGAPFNISFPPPAAPSNLIVTPISNSVLMLTWTDNSNNETGFEIEISSNGTVGPFNKIGTVSSNIVTYNSTGLSPMTNYCYRVRSINSSGQSAYTTPVCGATVNNPNNGLDFGGTDAYVQVDNNAALQLTQFTIETWFRRDGTGITVTSGSGGIPNAVPLVTKGTSESENAPIDINYFLCIDNSSNTIAFDFEEGATGPSPSLNHPLSGTTVIKNGVWYHAAVTYDGITVKLYLNGNLDAYQDFSKPVADKNTGKLSIGTSLTSTGAPQGFFDGVMDEVRIWNSVRNLDEIQSTINSQLTAPQAGLVARWGLNEGTGTTISNSAGASLNGAILGTAILWVPGSPFNINFAPAIPSLVAPVNGATGVSTSPTLQVSVSDPESKAMTVRFYGRPKLTNSNTDFTIVALPDAQNYTKPGGSMVPFISQTNWIVGQQSSKNIVYVAMEGDITDTNTGTEWDNAVSAMSILESPSPGIPYGISIGNHDGAPATTTLYNEHFGEARFTGRSYYGGHYGSDNNNNFALFSAGGLDFIIINLGFGSSAPPSADVLNWANTLLQTTYSSRRAIVVNHQLLSGTSWSGPGQAIYDALKGNPNLFLMLCGHLDTEYMRTDSYNGNTIYTVLSDYQTQPNGGNGWLRLLNFSPVNNRITISSYSTTLGQSNWNSNPDVVLPYNMTPPNNYQLIGTTTAASGSTTSIQWPDLANNQEYDWYVTVDDGVNTITGPVWSFTTRSTSVPYSINATAGIGGTITPSGNMVVLEGTDQTFTITPFIGYDISDVLVDGVSQGAISGYTFTNVTTSHTISATFTALPNLALNKPATSDSQVYQGMEPTKANDADGTNNSYWNGSQYPQWWKVDLEGVYDVTDIVIRNWVDNIRSYEYVIEGSLDDKTYSTIVTKAGTAVATDAGDQYSIPVTVRYLRVRMTGNSANEGVHISDFRVYGVASTSSYTIASSAGAGGSINPLGVVAITSGSSQTFTITHGFGYDIADVKVGGVSVGAVSSYTFTNVTASQTISATFTALPNLALNKPATSDSQVYQGMEPTKANDADGTNNSYWNGSQYPQWWKVDLEGVYDVTDIVIRNWVDNIRSYEYVIEGSLDDKTYSTIVTKAGTAVATDAGDQYSIPVTVRYLRVRMTGNSANEGVHISDFRVYGVASTSSYTIASSAGAGGSINPLGVVAITSGSSQTFTITHGFGYDIADVKVGGVSVGAVSSYTFTNVTASQTISATFTALPNLALNKPATSDSQVYQGMEPTKANDADGTNNSYWNGSQYPQWWKVDLEGVYDVTDIVIRNWVDNIRSYEYVIEGSLDDKTYSTIVTKAGTAVATDAGDQYSIPVTVRYLRVRMTGNSANEGVHISDFRVYGVASTSSYTIASSAGAGGSINPLGVVAITSGSSQTFTITHGFGYDIADVKVGGVSVGAVSSYTFTNVTASQTISATFTALPNLALNKPATSDSQVYQGMEPTKANDADGTNNSYWNGSQYPQWWKVDLEGVYDVTDIVIRNWVDNIRSYEYVIEGSLDDKTYSTIVTKAGTAVATDAGDQYSIPVTVRYLRVRMTGNSANEGVHISDFRVYGVASTSSYTIASSAGAGGSINPLGVVAITSGSSQTFTITHGFGYDIADVKVGGVSVGAVSSYTFTNVTASQTISATFTALPNLALNKPATSDSPVYQGMEPTKANDADGTNNSYWMGYPYPKWWKVDLEGVYDVTDIVIRNWVDNIRSYEYVIEGSLDDKTYSTIVTKAGTAVATDAGDLYSIPSTVQFLKVTMTGNSANEGVHITDFRVYGTEHFTGGAKSLNTSDSPILKQENKSQTEQLNIIMNVYPNPFSEQFTLRIDSPDEQMFEVSIIDLKGVVVYKANKIPANRDITFDQQLARGIYLLRVNNSETTIIRRIVKH